MIHATDIDDLLHRPFLNGDERRTVRRAFERLNAHIEKLERALSWQDDVINTLKAENERLLEKPGTVYVIRAREGDDHDWTIGYFRDEQAAADFVKRAHASMRRAYEANGLTHPDMPELRDPEDESDRAWAEAVWYDECELLTAAPAANKETK